MTTTSKASLLIVNEDGLVAGRGNSTRALLPEVEVAPGRVGISLSRAVREQLQLEVFCLVLPYTSDLPFHVLRLQSADGVLPPGFLWMQLGSFPECDVIGKALEHFSSSDSNFARFAWYQEIVEWLNHHVGRLGYEIRRLEQWNGRVGGVLIRVVSSGPDFWFKAVSDFNAREFWIAQLLAERHPGRFPKVLASGPRWNAFLLEHIFGEELHGCNDLSVWKQVAELLADTQVRWIGESKKLLVAGAADLRPLALIGKIPEFLQYVASAMARQEKMPPSILGRPELAKLGDELRALCSEVAAFPFAEALANSDFSPHNTLLTGTGPMFIDWAEACVSFPLIVGEYMWNRMAIEAPTRVGWQKILRETYLHRWASYYSSELVQNAARLLPSFAVFALLVFLHEREGNGPSEYDLYLRSLARRLKREVDQLELGALTSAS